MQEDIKALRQRLDGDLAPAERERVLAAIRTAERGLDLREVTHQPRLRAGAGKAPEPTATTSTSTPERRVPLEEQRRKTLLRQRRYQARLRAELGLVQVSVKVPEHRTEAIKAVAKLLRDDPDLELDLDE
jgi:hypothetical protein